MAALDAREQLRRSVERQLASFEYRAEEESKYVSGYTDGHGRWRPDTDGERRLAKLAGWCEALRWVLRSIGPAD